jgi:hypothetical protein
MTLLGAALECAIKGLAVALGTFNESDGRIQFVGVRGAESHALADMANSLGIVLTDDERKLFRSATEYLSWAGRYPTAKNLARTSNAMKDGLLRFTVRDLEIATRFAERLKKQAVGKLDA